MKKFKFLPSVLMLVLCVAVLAVGIYAVQPTQNKIEGSITIGATNPAVDITVYYVPDGVTVENAILNDANMIGTKQTARYGVDIDLTDTRLDFDDFDEVNTKDDVNPKNIAIKLENTSGEPLGAYFTNVIDSTEVKTELPLNTYNSNTTFTEETLVEGYAKATFSDYTQIPGKVGEVNGQAVVTMTISLIQLPEQELTIKPSAVLVIDEFDGELVPPVEIGEANKPLTAAMYQAAGNPAKVKVKDGVTGIDAEAFKDANLTSISIPSSVTSIGANAFLNCTALATVYNNSALDIVAGTETHGYVAKYATAVYENGKLVSIVEDNVVYSLSTGDKIAIDVINEYADKINIADNCVGIASGAICLSQVNQTLYIPNSVQFIEQGAITYDTTTRGELNKVIIEAGDPIEFACNIPTCCPDGYERGSKLFRIAERDLTFTHN